jgi:uncharacterized protein with HEPN domain
LPLEDRDPAHLWDMLEAAQTLRELTAGLAVAAYLVDRKTQLAVERAIEILGEAARRVSPALQQSHPEIPWAGIIAQRNVIAHEYGEIKQERLWVVATVHVEDLIPKLRLLVPPAPPEGNT